MHFSAQALLSHGDVALKRYVMPESVRELIYKPYLEDYKKAYLTIRKVASSVDGMASRPHEIESDWTYLKRVRRRYLNGENKYFYWLFH